MKNKLLLGFGTLGVSLIAVIGLSRAQGLELHGRYSAQSAMSTGFFYQGRLKKGAGDAEAIGRAAWILAREPDDTGEER